MLIDEPKIHAQASDPIHAMIAMINGNTGGAQRLQQGIYQIGGFGSSDFLRGYEQYPELVPFSAERYFGSYGVCDGPENLLEVMGNVLNDPSRQFVVTLTSVKRSEQSPDGGWRWHKWGEYIGKHNPQCEYLYDEEGIEEVFCYHVYEKV